MELIILGSGTYQPELERHCSSYLLKVSGQNLVFDFGRGVLDQLMKIGVKYNDIDEIFITHKHADHCSELASFLHISLAESKYGPKRKKEITIYGPEGIRETIDHMLEAFHLSHKRPKHKVIVKELEDGDAVKGGGWVVRAFNAKHVVTSITYRLESDKRVFAYSGDTKDCAGLRKACKNADVAVIEASWPEGIESKDHMTGAGAGRVAKESDVKKLVLTHAAPYYLKNYNVIGDAKKHFKGNVLIAKDMMRIRI